MIEVAAGLVFDNGKLLITQRPQGTHLSGLWEFPGGKREAAESFKACLVRELLEELGIRVRVGALFHRLTHHYPDKAVYLEFYLCSLLKNSPKPTAIGCAAFSWVEMHQLAHYQFPDADRQLVSALTRSSDLWGIIA